MIGILAYGSLIANPGAEIEAATADVIRDIQTPFEVEFARKSKGRGNAPTLVPVENGQGSRVNAWLYLLRPDVTELQAINILYRREMNRVGDLTTIYVRPSEPTENSVLVETAAPMNGADIVLYTRIGANLPEILDPQISVQKKADRLARLAVDSLTKETYDHNRDGIQYLADNLAAGVVTPLSRPYEAAILQLAGEAQDLAEARRRIARQKLIIP